MNRLRSTLCLLAVVLLVGCAHPISISPNVPRLDSKAGTPSKVKANVGYYMPPELLSLEVTTPGGGGDKVRYFPYKDLDSAYMRILMSVFEGVNRLNSANNAAELSSASINYVVSPILVTNSDSTGVFTWPPTSFTIDLTSNIREPSGQPVASPRVVGSGQVLSFSEFKGDFGLSGRIAMEDALLKMQRALLDVSYASTGIGLDPSKTGAQSGKEDTALKLNRLKELFDKGLITQSEYESRKSQLIRDL